MFVDFVAVLGRLAASGAEKRGGLGSVLSRIASVPANAVSHVAGGIANASKTRAGKAVIGTGLAAGGYLGVDAARARNMSSEGLQKFRDETSVQAQAASAGLPTGGPQGAAPGYWGPRLRQAARPVTSYMASQQPEGIYAATEKPQFVPSGGGKRTFTPGGGSSLTEPGAFVTPQGPSWGSSLAPFQAKKQNDEAIGRLGAEAGKLRSEDSLKKLESGLQTYGQNTGAEGVAATARGEKGQQQLTAAGYNPAVMPKYQGPEDGTKSINAVRQLQGQLGGLGVPGPVAPATPPGTLPPGTAGAPPAAKPVAKPAAPAAATDPEMAKLQAMLKLTNDPNIQKMIWERHLARQGGAGGAAGAGVSRGRGMTEDEMERRLRNVQGIWNADPY